MTAGGPPTPPGPAPAPVLTPAAPAAPAFPTAGQYWKPPVPYGRPASVDAAGTVAAPLLAGFSITFVGLILSASDGASIPLREPALAVLVLAALLLLGCVQCAFWARLYTVTPQDLMPWWPDLHGGSTNAQLRHRQIRGAQWRYAHLSELWLERARWTYHGGILALLASVALVLVPANHHLAWRWLSVGVTGLGFFAELYWVLAPGRDGWPGVAALFPGPRDVQHLAEVQPGAYTGPDPQP